tara:strand:+ start:10337 stop:10477 length:141 start_codon:yes stop_codon:yes gene_type:complete
MELREFSYYCIDRAIHPDIALENKNIIEALKNRDDKEVIRLLDTEF